MNKTGRNNPCPRGSGRKYIDSARIKYEVVRGEPDGTASHPTRLPKDVGEVAGYQGEQRWKLYSCRINKFQGGNPQRYLNKRPDAGFVYLGLLFLLAIMGIVSVAALQAGVVIHRRAAEEALLNVGSEFSQALESYRRATPAGQPDQPLSLQDLLRDPRFPGVVRHLRKLYYDPITGQQEWGVLREEESKQIVGVFSLSNAQPIKIANFDLRLKNFAGKSSYQEWVFTSTQAAAASSGGPKLISPLELMGEPEANPATSTATDSSHQLSPGETSPRDLME